MATNPRIPPRHGGARVQKHRKSSASYVIFGIIAATILLAAILYFRLG
ncbi:MAG TPA: hypothetical protein VMU28_05185 [Terriglobales bacterium]|nr:hypothetical protein [Terriglobales bacterium]